MKETPVCIFSDGSSDDLGPLLALPLTQRLTFGSSIADLLALSYANVLITSGGSSFSQWASYLGRMPVIWRTGTNYPKLYYDHPELEVECQGGFGLPTQFLDYIRMKTAA